jgi:hypothetical protein
VNYRKAQLAAWEAEVMPKLERRKSALRLVLKFKADVHARREARVADTMQRLADPAFPRELLLMVIESATGSQSLQWWPSEDHTLDLLADSFFLWPRGVESDTRSILRQTVADVMLKAFLTTLLLRVTAQDTLMIPLSLNGNSIHVRRLVVHLTPMFIFARGDIYGCSADDRDMELLKLSFPRLEVCVCFLPIANFWPFLEKKPQANAGAARQRLAQVIASFLEFGPGRRKLVRCNVTGSLVEFGYHEASGSAYRKLHAKEVGDEENLFALHAERIVEHFDTFYRRSSDTG